MIPLQPAYSPLPLFLQISIYATHIRTPPFLPFPAAHHIITAHLTPIAPAHHTPQVCSVEGAKINPASRPGTVGRLVRRFFAILFSFFREALQEGTSQALNISW